MAERLGVVEEAFTAGGRGVVVAPKITLAGSGAPISVRLKLPDGTERQTRATFDVAHIRGPLSPFAMIRLPELGVADVPAGTEIWTVP